MIIIKDFTRKLQAPIACNQTDYCLALQIISCNCNMTHVASFLFCLSITYLPFPILHKVDVELQILLVIHSRMEK